LELEIGKRPEAGKIPNSNSRKTLYGKLELEIGIAVRETLLYVKESGKLSKRFQRFIPASLKSGKRIEWQRKWARWYSLGDSFCIDVMDLGLDPKTYSHICRHSLQTALKYYQKYTEHREHVACKSMENSPLWGVVAEMGSKNPADSPLASVDSCAEYQTLRIETGSKMGDSQGTK